MALPPPNRSLVPVLHPRPICPAASRELHLLRLRAETFLVELELENQLRLQGIALLPPEWTTYIENQRQIILATIQRIESREEDFTSSLGMAHSAHPTRTLPSIRDHNESTTGLRPAVPSIRPEEIVYSFVLPENEGSSSSQAHSTTIGEEGSPSQEAHTHPDSISSTVHGHADEHIRQSPAIVMGSPSLDHENTQRDSPRRTASTRRGTDPRRVERAHYEPHAGMFNGAQSITISGGVFNIIQGNVSSMADEILAPK